MLSIKFANDAINLLMDLLNDDVEVVRLEALDSLFHIAVHECLNIHEKHMHMVYFSEIKFGLNLLVSF